MQCYVREKKKVEKMGYFFRKGIFKLYMMNLENGLGPGG